MTWLSDIVNNKRVGSSVAKACWKTGGPNDEGYTQKGMKKKGGETVPNCVPAASVAKVTNKQFEPHEMYKGNSSVKADTHQEHLDLKDKGYGHSPAKMTDEEYDKKNAKMRRDHASGVTYTSPTKLADQQKSGTGSARISFAARFGGQGHSMTEKDGSPSGYAHALKRWGFSSGAQATAFANKHKKQ